MARIVAGLAVLLLEAGCTPPLQYSEPRLTSGANLSQGKRRPAQTFDLNDRIVMLVDVIWPNPTADGTVVATSRFDVVG